MPVKTRLQVISIISQTNAFWIQKTLKSSCTTKETVHIEIIITLSNGDTQRLRITTIPPNKNHVCIYIYIYIYTELS